MLRITFGSFSWVEREKSKIQIFQKFMSILIGEADFFPSMKPGLQIHYRPETFHWLERCNTQGVNLTFYLA